MSLTFTQPSTGTPVTVAELKAHLRIDQSAEDDVLNAILAAASAYVEEQTRLQLLTATAVLGLDAFPRCGLITLPRPPIQQVTSVIYIEDGVQQTLDPAYYHADVSSIPGRITRPDGVSWPVADPQPNSVKITFTCGYGDADKVPALLKTAIKMYAGHLYEHREAVTDRRLDVVPMAVESIVNLFRMPSAIG